MSIPFCKDCAHHQVLHHAEQGSRDICRAADTQRPNPVTGEPSWSMLSQWCETARSDRRGLCGPTGKLFYPKGLQRFQNLLRWMGL